MEDDDPEYYTLRYRVVDDAVVVASSGWGASWRDLEDGDLLVVERHSLELSVRSAIGLSAAS